MPNIEDQDFERFNQEVDELDKDIQRYGKNRELVQLRNTAQDRVNACMRDYRTDNRPVEIAVKNVLR